MAGRAFDFRRAWRAEAGSQWAVPFSHVDALVLSLAIDHAAVDSVVCADTPLRDRLDGAFRAARRENPIRCVAEPDGNPHIRLSGLDGTDVTHGECAGHLVYGLNVAQPLSALANLGSRLLLLRLGSRSPALWQCGLGLIVDDAGLHAGETFADAVAQSMRGEWIDPLVLFETVQILTAKLHAIGAAGLEDLPSVDDRVAQLEAEIATLRRAALVREHVLLTEAAQRHRVGA